MMRIALVAAAVAALAVAGCNKNNGTNQAAASTDTVKITQATPPPGGTWADVVNETQDGVMMGNPKAKVKLVEIASLGCPFCKRFEDEGSQALIDNYVKPGKVSYEFRAYLIHGPVDMAANLIAYCNGPKAFFPLSRAMYADQKTWMGKIEGASKDQIAQIENLPTNQTYVAMAKFAGLDDWAAVHGVPHAKSIQCLTDQSMIDHQAQVSVDVNNDFPEFKGTPSFVINGTMLDNVGSWDKLQPELDKALK